MLKTTAGKLIIQSVLPDDMKHWGERTLDKKTLTSFLSELAQRHPDQYSDVTHQLLKIAGKATYESGSNSFGLKHIRVSPIAARRREELAREVSKIDDDDSLTDKQRNDKLVHVVADAKEGFDNELLEEAKSQNSPLARMISSGSRGDARAMASLRGGDLQYVDSEGHPVPVPITKSYSEGLSPIQYWSGSYGARQGLLAAKFATADSGYLAKRLQQASHRLLVTALDEDHDPSVVRGVPTDIDDAESEGSLLASPIAGYPRNTILTPKILGDLKRQGVGRMLIRSPIVGGARDGGLLSRDVGIRENGRLPYSGSLVGLSAAQSLAERLTQQALGAKHLGGIAGKGTQQLIEGFPLVEQLIDIPKTFRGGATHSQVDGQVHMISDAPAGGKFITIDGHDHYVPVGAEPLVGRGDTVEAGDTLSSGVPNPAEIVRHKGIGEGRRYFTHQLRNVLRNAGVNAHRRNVELVARAMVDRVRLDDQHGEYMPGDLVSYQSLERDWQPREGTQELEPRSAIGKYLEKPVLHHTIGTKIKPSMLRDFTEFGVNKIHAHDEPPPFQPEMVRSMDILGSDPDWMAKMYGSGLKKNLLHDVHRGAVSDTEGTSFVPGLARGVDFGLYGKVKSP
jgi:DNA-directed RNA polymerase subunit beta'